MIITTWVDTLQTSIRLGCKRVLLRGQKEAHKHFVKLGVSG